MGVSLEETVNFLELHGSGEQRHNCRVRSKKKFRWQGPIDRLRQEGIYISVWKEIKTWADGVVYRAVASGHKPPHFLDQRPEQWARGGAFTPLMQLVPRKWQRPGFVRRQRM